MSTHRTSTVEAEELCQLVKVAEPSQWQRGQSEGSLKCTFGVVCEPPRRGLRVEIYINRGHKIKRQTINLGLFDDIDGEWIGIYQLTVADEKSCHHRENGVSWYGSHEHIGDSKNKRNELDNKDFQVALRVFCDKINLTLDAPITDPLDPSKFRLA